MSKQRQLLNMQKRAPINQPEMINHLEACADVLSPNDQHELATRLLVKLYPNARELSSPRSPEYWSVGRAFWNANNEAQKLYLTPVEHLINHINTIIGKIIGIGLRGFGEGAREAIDTQAAVLAAALGQLDMALAKAETGLGYAIVDAERRYIATRFYETARDYAACRDDGEQLRQLIAEANALDAVLLGTREDHKPGRKYEGMVDLIVERTAEINRTVKNWRKSGEALIRELEAIQERPRTPVEEEALQHLQEEAARHNLGPYLRTTHHNRKPLHNVL